MANLLTSVRLLLIPPIAAAFVSESLLPGWLLLTVLLIAIATDYFDGRVARATAQTSARGQLFDHGTDFLLVTCSLAALAYAGLISYLLPLLITIAFGQYVLDSYYLYRQKQLRMSALGRWNGIFYFLPLLLVAGSRTLPPGQFPGWLLSAAVIVSQLLILTTLLSIIDRSLAPLRTRR